MGETGHPNPYDLLGFQECADPELVLRRAGLAGQYTIYQGGMALSIAYRTKSWVLIAQGQQNVAEDMRSQYFGIRVAQWVRLRHMRSGKIVLFMNHHGPLPINSGGVCGGLATAYNLL